MQRRRGKRNKTQVSLGIQVLGSHLLVTCLIVSKLRKIRIRRVDCIVQDLIAKTSFLICLQVHRDLLLFPRKMKICRHQLVIIGRVQLGRFCRKKLITKLRVGQSLSLSKNISKWRKNQTKQNQKLKSINSKMTCFKKTVICLNNRFKICNSNLEKHKLIVVITWGKFKVYSRNLSTQSNVYVNRQ